MSSFVCFHLVVLPALRKMGGWAEPQLRRVAARLAVDIKLDPERPEYHRCTLQWGPPPLGSTPALKAAVAEAAAAQVRAGTARRVAPRGRTGVAWRGVNSEPIR